MNLWSNKSVLVTGSSGFVGRYLVNRLLELGARVTCFDLKTSQPYELLPSSEISIITGSVADYDLCKRLLEEQKIDSVFHLAAQAIVGSAHKAPLETFESNIRGTYSLMEACRCTPSVDRIVVASSDKAYGNSPHLPYTEEMPLRARHPYDSSKACTDIIAQTYHATYNLPVAIARCGNIFGGGDLNFSRIFPSVIQSFHEKNSPIIRSNGKFQRDYIYVEDVVDAYLLLGANLHKPSICGEAFNFGPNHPLSVLEIVETIAHLMNCESIPLTILDKAEGEIIDQYLNSEKAHTRLQWKITRGFKESVEKTIEWYLSYFSTVPKAVLA